MSGLDPAIVEHHIDTWPNANPICQKMRPINPSKREAVKAKIDKLKQAGFIYPVKYTTWASNPVHILKKQGTIHVCTNFHTLKKACPKDNFPTPFINKIIDECARHDVLSFMDGFSGYNQIVIHRANFLVSTKLSSFNCQPGLVKCWSEVYCMYLGAFFLMRCV